MELAHLGHIVAKERNLGDMPLNQTFRGIFSFVQVDTFMQVTSLGQLAGIMPGESRDAPRRP